MVGISDIFCSRVGNRALVSVHGSVCMLTNANPASHPKPSPFGTLDVCRRFKAGFGAWGLKVSGLTGTES